MPDDITPAPAGQATLPLGQPTLPAAAAQPPAQPQQQPPAPAAAQAAPILQVHAEDWHAIQKELNDLKQYRASQESERAAAEGERLRLAAEKAGMTEELKKHEEANRLRYAEVQAKYETLEAETRGEKLESTLAASLNGVEFNGPDPAATAALVRRLLKDDIEATRDAGGKWVVRDRKTYKPAAEYLKERLASPEFSIFLKPTRQPGTGANATLQQPGAPPAQAGSLDAIVGQWRDRRDQYQSFGLRPAIGGTGNGR